MLSKVHLVNSCYWLLFTKLMQITGFLEPLPAQFVEQFFDFFAKTFVVHHVRGSPPTLCNDPDLPAVYGRRLNLEDFLCCPRFLQYLIQFCIPKGA